MNLKELPGKVRCDMPNCKNIATLKVEKEGFFRSTGLFLCKECMEDMYKLFASKITPKSPSNMLNKKVKINKEV